MKSDYCLANKTGPSELKDTELVDITLWPTHSIFLHQAESVNLKVTYTTGYRTLLHLFTDDWLSNYKSVTAKPYDIQWWATVWNWNLQLLIELCTVYIIQ